MAIVHVFYHGVGTAAGGVGIIAGAVLCASAIVTAEYLDQANPEVMAFRAERDAMALRYAKASGEDSVILPETMGHYREGDITPSLVASYGGKCVNGGVYATFTRTDGTLSDQTWQPCK